MYFDHRTLFKTWSRGATGGKMISSMSSTTLDLSIFIDVFW